MAEKGVLVVVSGPSGAGKGTVLKYVMESDGRFVYSVSATTRQPREGERDGVEYHFVTREKFEEYIACGAVVEHTEYAGNYYGTLKSEIEGKLEAGLNVILEIEVDGAQQIKAKFPDSILIMLSTPDYATLEARLRGRGTNTEEDIQRRLARACEEIRLLSHYDYLVINYDNAADKAAEQILDIVSAEALTARRNPSFPEEFLSNK